MSRSGRADADGAVTGAGPRRLEDRGSPRRRSTGPVAFPAVLATLGDVIHDVVVRLGGPIQHGTDTPSTIVHRRGGSAANVAVAAARLAGRARFIGQLGDDESAAWLRGSLVASGVEVVGHVGGRSGTVVSLVDETAERSMLTDRGSAQDLRDPKPVWLDGAGALHVPMYSFEGEPLAGATRTLIAWAQDRRLVISLDASSTSLLHAMGIDRARALIRQVRPDVLLVNEDEALALGEPLRPAELATKTLVIKQGRRPAIVRWDDRSVYVPVPPTGPVLDTTGAGDAFAAGYLVAMLDRADPVEAAAAGHRSAAWAIAAASSSDR